MGRIRSSSLHFRWLERAFSVRVLPSPLEFHALPLKHQRHLLRRNEVALGPFLHFVVRCFLLALFVLLAPVLFRINQHPSGILSFSLPNEAAGQDHPTNQGHGGEKNGPNQTEMCLLQHAVKLHRELGTAEKNVSKITISDNRPRATSAPNYLRGTWPTIQGDRATICVHPP